MEIGDRVNVLIPCSFPMAGIVTEISDKFIRVKKDWSSYPVEIIETLDLGTWYEAYKVKPRKSSEEELAEAIENNND